MPESNPGPLPQKVPGSIEYCSDFNSQHFILYDLKYQLQQLTNFRVKKRKNFSAINLDTFKWEWRNTIRSPAELCVSALSFFLLARFISHSRRHLFWRIPLHQMSLEVKKIRKISILKKSFKNVRLWTVYYLILKVKAKNSRKEFSNQINNS